MGKLSHKLSVAVIIFLGITSLKGATIKEVVEQTITNNSKINSIIKNNEAYRLYVDETKKGYYPKLDLKAFISAKKTKTNPDDSSKTSQKTEGYNAQLDFEQLIYDGGLTTNKTDEAQYRYTSNKYLNASIIDDIIYDSIDSYLNLLKYEQRLNIGKESINIYNEYHKTAVETEEINGEALHKSQVNSKIHYANNKIYQDKQNYERAINSYKKNVGIKPDGESCQPNINNSLVPKDIKTLIDKVLLKSPKILEQIENIKEQRAILHQRNSSFYPTIKFKAQAIYDENLLSIKEKTQIYSARVELTYNIFNGGKDKVATSREKLFLLQSQKTLDSVINDVIDEITAAYNSYKFAKKREIELKKYIQDNKEILSLYKDQFEGGTRTFIDVLNVERDLIGAKEDLADIKYEVEISYYKIFKNLGTIKETVLDTNNDTCSKLPKLSDLEKKELKSEKDLDDMKALLEEDESLQDKDLQTTPTINNTYALYLVAYKNRNNAQKNLIKVQKQLGEDYSIKLEESGDLNSIVVYNLGSKDEARSIKEQLKKSFSGSYIKKIVK